MILAVLTVALDQHPNRQHITATPIPLGFQFYRVYRSCHMSTHDYFL